MTFHGALRVAMKRRGMSQAELARTLGVTPSTVRAWLTGAKLPQHRAAVRVADVLMQPMLVSLSESLRERTCPIDGRRFLDMTRAHRAIYCSRRCNSTALSRQARGKAQALAVVHAALTTKRLNLYVSRVDAMCHACEPEGMCRMADCELRSVSPLPLADARVRVA